MQQELEESKNNLKQININARYNAEKLKQCKEKLENADKEAVKKKSTLEEKIDSALALGPRVQTKR